MPTKRDTDLIQVDALLREAVDLLAASLRAGATAPARDKHPNTGKPWSSEADAELRALFESGNSIADLSLYFQRTANGVRARLVKLGLLDTEEFRPRFAA